MCESIKYTCNGFFYLLYKGKMHMKKTIDFDGLFVDIMQGINRRETVEISKCKVTGISANLQVGLQNEVFYL